MSTKLGREEIRWEHISGHPISVSNHLLMKRKRNKRYFVKDINFASALNFNEQFIFLWKPKDKQSRHKYWSLVVMYPETINHRSAQNWHVSSRTEMSGIKQWTVNTSNLVCYWNGLDSDSFLEASHITCNTVGKQSGNNEWMLMTRKGKMVFVKS